MAEHFQPLDERTLEVLSVDAVEVVQAKVLIGLATRSERVDGNEQTVGDRDEFPVLTAGAHLAVVQRAEVGVLGARGRPGGFA